MRAPSPSIPSVRCAHLSARTTPWFKINQPARPVRVGARTASLPPLRRQRGFALLITIVLVAFLVLLLVGLATFTRVETQVASNAQQQAQARQNALMALNIAVGQLQKYAGPDQRTTARADLQHPAAANRHWVGVYGSAAAANYADDPVAIATTLTNSGNIGAATGSPARLLNWLVSGNERVAFDPRRSTGDVGPLGQIVNAPATADIPFAPTPATANLTDSTTATADNLALARTSGGTRTARLLVGGNSVTSELGAGTPLDYVVAPAVDITAPAAQVPGYSATDPDVTVGRYAWWVGDEGVKARVDLPMAGSDTSRPIAERQEERINAFFSTTRSAIELMGRDHTAWGASAPDTTTIGADYHTEQKLKKVISLPQLPMTSDNPASLGAALKHRYHDLTPHSRSLLSDTYAGGLKRDLSILLDSSYAPGASDPTLDGKRLWEPAAADTGAFPSGTIAGFGIPTWRHLRSYYQTRVPLAPAPGADSLPVRLPAHDKAGANPEPDHVGVAPVITYFSVGWRMAPAAAPVSGTQINMNLYPLVVLWNPYNFTLRAPAKKPDGSNFEVGMHTTFNVTVALEVETAANTWARRGTFDFKVDTSPVAQHSTKHKFMRFRLDCPDIPPGQSLIFSLPDTSSGNPYNQQNLLRNIEPEESSYVTVPFRAVGSATTAATVAATEAGSNYRVTEYIVGTDNFSSSLRPGGGGGINMYLGEPDDITHVLAEDFLLDSRPGGARQLLNPSTSGPAPHPNRRWYNTHQNIGWDNNVATSPFQGPEQLVHDPLTSQPAYIILAQALFSGHGQNGDLDQNQFMFNTRWIAQGNMRAVRSGRTRRDSNYNPLYIASAGSPTVKTPWQKFSIGASPAGRTSAGQGHDWIGGNPVDAFLFEFPHEGQNLFSIAQLQHANLSFFGGYPSYPIGNSLADYRLRSAGGTDFPTLPAGHQLVRTDRRTAAIAELAADQRGYYDISYLLNRALWDRYYFSTVPATGTIPATLPNRRHVVSDSSINLRNPDRSAAALLVEGGFNVNSTSEHAWRAIIGAVNKLPFDPKDPADDHAAPLKAAFSRFSRPTSDDDPNEAWTGYRTLSDNQVAQLARNIVIEVRNRGPFVSLADFVNRRLADGTGSADNNEIYRGALQSAIDRTASASSSTFPANNPSAGSFWANDAMAVGDPTNTAHRNQATQYTLGYWEKERLEGSMSTGAATARAAGNRSAFAPKYLTQADLLSSIGAGLSGRSDTFTIRAYGETLNPATGVVESRAWCEATVQRTVDYVDKAVTDLKAWETPAAGGDDETFGRRFVITSFRWLSPSDI